MSATDYIVRFASRLAMMAAMAMAPAAAQVLQASSARSLIAAVHDDWSVLCFQDQHRTPACEIAQLVRDRGQSDSRIVQFGLSCIEADRQCGVQILLPPGTDPARDVLMQYGDGFAPIAFPVIDCVASWCIAGGALPFTVIDELRNRTSVRLLFHDRQAGAQDIPVTFRGFDAALAEMIACNSGSDDSDSPSAGQQQP